MRVAQKCALNAVPEIIICADSPGDNHAFGAGRDGGNATIVFIDSPGAGERAHCAGYDGGAATVSTYCSSLGIY